MSIGRRLGRLEVPTEAKYAAARDRAMAHVIRSCGAELEPVEEAMLDGYGERDFAADCEIMERYRAPRPPDRRVRLQHGLIRQLYRELEQRGADPYLDGEE